MTTVSTLPWYKIFDQSRLYGITIVFNYGKRNTYSFRLARTKIKLFANVIERRRYGSRHHRKIFDRTQMLLAPEKFGDGHPHYHGFIELPSDMLGKLGEEAALLMVQDAWKKAVPGGSILISKLDHVEGWNEYCCKETSFSDDEAIFI